MYKHTHTHTPAQGTWRELARAPVRRRAVTAALGLRQLALLSQHGCGGGGDDAHAVSYPRVQRVFPVVIGHGNHSQGKDLRAEKKKRQTVDYTAALVLLPVAAWSHYRPGINKVDVSVINEHMKSSGLFVLFLLTRILVLIKKNPDIVTQFMEGNKWDLKHGREKKVLTSAQIFGDVFTVNYL